MSPIQFHFMNIEPAAAADVPPSGAEFTGGDGDDPITGAQDIHNGGFHGSGPGCRQYVNVVLRLKNVLESGNGPGEYF